MRRVSLLLMVTMAALLMASGVALAVSGYSDPSAGLMQVEPRVLDA